MLDYISQIQQNAYVFSAVIAWSFIWKGWALWRAARLRQAGWYVALLVVNTLGLFEIIYLIATAKRYKKVFKKDN